MLSGARGGGGKQDMLAELLKLGLTDKGLGFIGIVKPLPEEAMA